MDTQEAWKFVHEFRDLVEPDSQDIVNLEIYMHQILNAVDIESHSKDLGYSARFPRFSEHYPDLTPKKELEVLRAHYWGRKKEVERLQTLIREKERNIQRNCVHEWERDWSDRGHRSHHDCKKCGAYR